MYNKAIGLIETLGFVAAVEAADACLKAALVDLLSYRFTRGGLVTVIVTGDVGAVKAAVEAGHKAAESLSKVISVHVIPRPSDETISIIDGLVGESTAKISEREFYQKEKNKIQRDSKELKTEEDAAADYKEESIEESKEERKKEESIEVSKEENKGEDNDLKQITVKLRSKLKDKKEKNILKDNRRIDEYGVKVLRRVLRVLADEDIDKSQIPTMRKKDIIEKLVEIASKGVMEGDG